MEWRESNYRLRMKKEYTDTGKVSQFKNSEFTNSTVTKMKKWRQTFSRAYEFIFVSNKSISKLVISARPSWVWNLNFVNDLTKGKKWIYMITYIFYNSKYADSNACIPLKHKVICTVCESIRVSQFTLIIQAIPL